MLDVRRPKAATRNRGIQNVQQHSAAVLGEKSVRITGRSLWHITSQRSNVPSRCRLSGPLRFIRRRPNLSSRHCFINNRTANLPVRVSCIVFTGGDVRVERPLYRDHPVTWSSSSWPRALALSANLREVLHQCRTLGGQKLAGFQLLGTLAA